MLHKGVFTCLFILQDNFYFIIIEGLYTEYKIYTNIYKIDTKLKPTVQVKELTQCLW